MLRRIYRYLKQKIEDYQYNRVLNKFNKSGWKHAEVITRRYGPLKILDVREVDRLPEDKAKYYIS